MPYEVFAAVDWYEVADRGTVAVIPRTSGYDPSPLVGQLVTINGSPWLVRGVEPLTDPDVADKAFGLLVEQR